jgi:cephalosporin hydroxylase
MSDPVEDFHRRNSLHIDAMSHDENLQQVTREWFLQASRHEYSYHFSWLGRPIIQFPQDIVAMQELIWNIKPDAIVETGVAHGGALVLYASLLELLGADGIVVGVDIDIRPHNRRAITEHALAHRIRLIEGSSVDEATFAQVRHVLGDRRRVLVALDSNHTHEHVLRELNLYSPLISRGSYLVVMDSVIEDLPEDFFPNRPWGRGNNPKTAIWEFLHSNDRFEIDRELEAKLQITVAPDGYLRCIKD